MIARALCLLGLHKWEVADDPWCGDDWVCLRCGKEAHQP